jgi:hypothetical protein
MRARPESRRDRAERRSVEKFAREAGDPRCGNRTLDCSIAIGSRLPGSC